MPPLLVDGAPLEAVILAGGRSTRFGSDKASALLRGRPLLQWVLSALEDVCCRVVVVRAAGQQLPDFESSIPVTVVEDRLPRQGPLAGLAAGFEAVRSPWTFVASCDGPLLAPGLVELLGAQAHGHDVVWPSVGGYLQPLAAMYRVAACLPVFTAALARGEGRILDVCGSLNVFVAAESVVATADPSLDSFRNVNRPESLVELERILLERERSAQ
jgi:molybdopterin-guanine dinucleotide biosynthesis protein A